MSLSQLTKINIAVSLVCASPSVAFINDKLMHTKIKSEQAKSVKVFNELLKFLIETQININNGVNSNFANKFINNLYQFSVIYPCSQSVRKIQCIKNLLEGTASQAKLAEILEKEQLSFEEKKFLGTYLSCLFIERFSFLEIVKILYWESFKNRMIRDGMNRELELSLDFSKTSPLWQVYVLDPGLPSGIKFSFEKVDFCVEEILKLKRAKPQLEEVCDDALLSIQICELLSEEDKVYESFDMRFYVDINRSESYELELFPLLTQVSQICENYFSSLASEYSKLKTKFLDAKKYNFRSLQKDNEFTVAYFENEENLSKRYLHSFIPFFDGYRIQTEKGDLYEKIYKKLSPEGKTLRNSFSNSQILPTPSQFSNLSLEIPTFGLRTTNLIETLLEQFRVSEEQSSPIPSLQEQPIIPAPSEDVISIPPIEKEDRKESSLATVDITPLSLFFPRTGLHLTNRLIEILTIHIRECSWRPYVAAQDIVNPNEYIIVMSSRMFALNFTAIRQQQLATHKKYPHRVASIGIDSSTVRLLSEEIDKYFINKQKDSRKTQGRIAGFLHRMFQGNSEQRIHERIEEMKSLFPQFLSRKQWGQLEKILKQNNEKEILSFLNASYNVHSFALMKIMHITCGEVKIALQCINDTKRLSPSAKEVLPKTLTERFTFITLKSTVNSTICMQNPALKRVQEVVKVGELDMAVLNVCPRCEQIWPILENVYQRVLQDRNSAA